MLCSRNSYSSICISFYLSSPDQVASTASLVSSPTINTPTTLTVNTVMPLTSTSVSSLSFTGMYHACFSWYVQGEYIDYAISVGSFSTFQIIFHMGIPYLCFLPTPPQRHNSWSHKHSICHLHCTDGYYSNQLSIFKPVASDYSVHDHRQQGWH